MRVASLIFCAPSGRMFYRVKGIANDKGIHREVESEGSRMAMAFCQGNLTTVLTKQKSNLTIGRIFCNVVEL